VASGVLALALLALAGLLLQPRLDALHHRTETGAEDERDWPL